MNIIALNRIPGHDSFQLKENENTVLDICHKTEMHTARISTQSERRVLIIEDESFLRIRLTIKNEYGIPIGSLVWDNFSDIQGSIEIESAKFRFIILEKSTPELQVFNKHKMVYHCQLAFEKSSLKEMRPQLSSSVIAVAWYLQHKTISVQPPASVA